MPAWQAEMAAMYTLRVEAAFPSSNNCCRNSSITPSAQLMGNANFRYLRCLWWIGTWKYASFKSIVIHQSFGMMSGTSRRGVSILNFSGMSALFNTRRHTYWQIIPVLFGDQEVT